MRRTSLALFVSLSAFLAPSSQAVARDLPLSPWTRFAVNDVGAYWVKTQIKGCRHCQQLWKTDLKTGKSTSVLQASETKISDLTASGQYVAFTETYRENGVDKTDVFRVDASDNESIMASAQYFHRHRSNCGSMVGAGPISPSGSVSWQKIVVTHPEGNCFYLGSSVTWSAYETNYAGHRRLLVQPRQSESELLAYDEAIELVQPIRGFNDSRLLTGPVDTYLTSTDISTGAMTRYSPPGFDDYSSSGELSPTGEVITAFGASARRNWLTAYFANPLDGSTYADLTFPGQVGGSEKFCNGELFQLAQFSRSVTITHRDRSGSVLGTRSFKLGKHLSTALLSCNSSTGVIAFDKMGDRGRIISEGAFSFDLY